MSHDAWVTVQVLIGGLSLVGVYFAMAWSMRK